MRQQKTLQKSNELILFSVLLLRKEDNYFYNKNKTKKSHKIITSVYKVSSLHNTVICSQKIIKIFPKVIINLFAHVKRREKKLLQGLSRNKGKWAIKKLLQTNKWVMKILKGNEEAGYYSPGRTCSSSQG